MIYDETILIKWSKEIDVFFQDKNFFNCSLHCSRLTMVGSTFRKFSKMKISLLKISVP